MMFLNRKFNFYLLLLFAAFYFPLSNPVLAAEDTNQKILDLRKQIEELTKQAEEYKKNVNQKQKEADTLARQIGILNNQILKLQTQIAITSRQVTSAKFEISDLETEIFDAQEKINRERKAIGQLLTLVAERDRMSLTAIILQSPRLSDFAGAIQQEQNLNRRLNELLIALKREKEELQSDKTELEEKKRELENLNARQIQQKNSADQTKTNKDRLLIQTKGQEKEYQKLLAEVEKKEAAFFAELKKLEAEAIQSGAFIIHVTAQNLPPKGSGVFQWPYEDFYITQGYGCTRYAKCGKASGPYGGAGHNGIDIASGYGSPIRPAAKGKILASGFNNGFGNWVAVRHEPWDLVSIYAHMNAPSGLANGTLVSTSSIIGYEGSTGNSTGPHLHFSVFRDFFTYINPKNGQLYFNYFEGSINPLDYL